jgi:hypothetical protein
MQSMLETYHTCQVVSHAQSNSLLTLGEDEHTHTFELSALGFRLNAGICCAFT